MYYRTSAPWLTIGRLRSGRDIRLSTATMRALNPRRLQLPTIFRLLPRSFICLFFLLLVVRAGQTRSVHHDDDLVEPGVKLSSVEDVARLMKAAGVPEQVQEEPVPSGDQEIDDRGASDPDKGQSKNIESISTEEVRETGQPLKEEDYSVAKKRRRNDVALGNKSNGHEVGGSPIEEVKDQGIRRFDVRVDADDVVPVDSKEEPSVTESEKSSFGEEESRIQAVDESGDEIPGSFRKSVKLDDEDGAKSEQEVGSNDQSDLEENRGYRSLSESQVKSRRKSSTVYLSAEEKKISDGQQQSIVEGQIKKLISIRDDVLDAQKSEKPDGDKLASSKREIGMDEVAFMEQEAENERRDQVKNVESIIEGESPGIGILEKWKDEAAMLQGRIKDQNFLSRLREQSIEVLPGVPKFTEHQLLDTLERIALSKRLQPLNESYTTTSANDVALTETQLRIIKCAEQLLAARERRPFVENLMECIRGLSVLNCMRIFVLPILLDNLPQSLTQNLPNLPIEINVFDLFQGTAGQKSGRAQDIQRVRLIAPDAVVHNILQDALESYPSDQTLVSYIDPKNETLKNLLSSNQLSILQMAEKFLPEPLRREYSDRMFSCVRRFEYFSCVKYFAWPLIKQYFPALPAFPDYQSWYPIIDLSPQYPILPFPGFTEDHGELPEIVDADATRTRRPRPEAVIIRVLQNTLKEQPRLSSSPSFLDQAADTYVALLPQDQLLTINMAEQLIPISYRPEFVQKTVRCMKEYNYLTCIKYSAWPTVRQFIPTLPDISRLLPDFNVPGLSDIGGYVPEIPTYPDVSFYWPLGSASVQKSTNVPTYYAFKNREAAPRYSDELENTILDILLKLRSTFDKSLESTSAVLTGNTITFTTFTKRQIDILRLAECLIPQSARATLITDVLTYLQKNNDFIDCARYVIWPTVARYQPSLLEFPSPENAGTPIDSSNNHNLLEIKETVTSTGEVIQERVISESENKAMGIFYQDNKESRNRVTSVPVISVSGTRFVPIFTEQPETVIYNILRSVQLQSSKTSARPTLTTKNQQFLDLLTEQQGNIVNIVDTLLPENVRPDFANRMIDCLRVNNFLICTRDIVWPALTQYFPWLPNFPNFGSIVGTVVDNSTTTTVNQNITEPGAHSGTPLSETDVKTGQHGDTTVTITDTRFLPIYNELPENIILNILKAVQLSVPSLQDFPLSTRIKELSQYLTEQQISIVQTATNLLPVPSRPAFIDSTVSCVRIRNFLECARDTIWPTVAQFFPWLPSFPNFGSLRGPQTSRNSANQKAAELAFEDVEEKIERILLDAKSNAQTEQIYLNVSDPVASHLSERQINIVNLVERIIPAPERVSYVGRMLECTKRYNYLACTNYVTWPILKQSVPSLPDLHSISDLFIRFPSILQIPESVGVKSADSFANYFLGNPQTLEIPQIPAGFSQPSVEVPQLPVDQGTEGLSGSKLAEPQIPPRSGTQETEANKTSSTTPSVGNEGIVPGYAGQPPGILINVSSEKVDLPGSQPETANSSTIERRKRRSTLESTNDYDVERASDDSSPSTFPNITESEYLRLLIRIKENAKLAGASSTKSKQYLVDTLNSTVRNSLTADQYEILKVIDDLDNGASSKGVGSQVVRCILSLSFIRCLGIFVWPMITSNLPSLLPSFPSFGIFGRSMSMENQVHDFFDMSTVEFEKALLKRRDSIEHSLLDWYRKLAEDEFQTNVGLLKIRGYGNNEIGISVTGFRQGRGAKIKDNKNLPSILTIITDIMEEVLDPRPEGEKKRDKEKKERSIDDEHREAGIQFLKDSDEYLDIKRSMNDDEIISMFLNKIKSNDSVADDDNAKYFDLENAYDAFEVLFGTKLHDKLSHDADPQFRSLDSVESQKQVDIVSLDSQKDETKTLSMSQVVYDFDKESTGDQEEKQRQKRAKNLLKSFAEKHSDSMDSSEQNDVDENKIIVEEPSERNTKSGLIIRLPRLDERIISKKMTTSVTQLARGLKMKMGEMMPGFGMVLSFLLQMALAHARAAASMAGMISNMALGSAMFGMVRDSLFGGNSHPQIKYVYDNHKAGPGIVWPSRYEPSPHQYDD